MLEKAPFAGGDGAEFGARKQPVVDAEAARSSAAFDVDDEAAPAQQGHVVEARAVELGFALGDLAAQLGGEAEVAGVGCSRRWAKMYCDEAEILLHGLVDNEIEAGHAVGIETHLRACAGCAAQLRQHRVMRDMMSGADLRFPAPPALRRRVSAMLPVAAAATPYRRPLFKGFAFGSALSAAAAALLMIAVIRSDQDQVIVSDVVSAHLRSLQANHLTDVQTSNQQGSTPGSATGSGLRYPSPT